MTWKSNTLIANKDRHLFPGAAITWIIKTQIGN